MAEAIRSPEAAYWGNSCRTIFSVSRKNLVGLHTSWQEDVPRQQGSGFSAVKTVLTDVLGTIRSTVVRQSEVNGEANCHNP